VRDRFASGEFVCPAEIETCNYQILNKCSEWAGRTRVMMPINSNIQDIFYVMKHNWLMQVCIFAADMILLGNQTCMICDGDLQYVGWKPSICDDSQCQFQFNNLGLGFSLAHQILHEKVLFDAYVSMLYSITHMSGDRVKMCFPEKVVGCLTDEKGAQTFYDFMQNVSRDAADKSRYQGRYGGTIEKYDWELEQDGSVKIPDVNRLKQVVERIPSVAEMEERLEDAKYQMREGNANVLAPETFLKNYLNDQDPLAYPLLKWLFTSNKAYVRLLKDDEKFTQFDTPYQFVFANANPEKEEQFQKLKRAIEKKKGRGNGVIQAWHGSGFGNWHSIMRNGLKNLSRTKYMTSGAAYGEGIYFSPNFSTSLSYSRTTNSWRGSQLGNSVCCMALCELINDPNLPRPNPHYVIPKEEWGMTRFLFIFSQSSNRRNLTLPLRVPEKLKGLFDTLS